MFLGFLLLYGVGERGRHSVYFVGLAVGGLELYVRPGLPRCRDAVMSDSWTSGRSGVGLAAYEAER